MTQIALSLEKALQLEDQKLPSQNYKVNHRLRNQMSTNDLTLTIFIAKSQDMHISLIFQKRLGVTSPPMYS